MGPTQIQPSINMVDADTVKKICDIYDWDGKGELDLFYLGDIMYAMGYNTTKKVCVGLGQTDEEGKKFAEFDDVVSKVEEALKTPDSQGTYADYVELLKLYDKNQNGTMMLAELDNILCNPGDEIPKEDVQKMFAEICDPEDEDGLFPYMSFLDRLTGKASNPTKTSMNLKNSAQGKFSNWPNASPLAAWRLRTLGPQQTERGTGGAEVRVLQVPPARFSSALCLAPPPLAALLSQHHSHFLASPVGYLYERGDR